MQVFISYDSSDSKLAHKLADDLLNAKIKVWIDSASIRAGESWVDSIGRGLEKSTHVVVLLTPDAVESAWVRQEVNAAIVRERKKQTRLIPLDVKLCDVPALWNNYQRISFRNYSQGFNELREILSAKKQHSKDRQPRHSQTINKAPAGVSERDMIELESYIQLYDSLYPKLSGEVRNYILNSVIVDQVYQLGSSTKFKGETLQKLFNQGTAGNRMVVLLLLQTHPSITGFNMALEAIENPISPFEQYHGLRSVSLMIHLLRSSHTKQLLRILQIARREYLNPVNRSRWEVYQSILQSVRSLVKGKSDKTKKISRK